MSDYDYENDENQSKPYDFWGYQEVPCADEYDDMADEKVSTIATSNESQQPQTEVTTSLICNLNNVNSIPNLIDVTKFPPLPINKTSPAIGTTVKLEPFKKLNSSETNIANDSGKSTKKDFMAELATQQNVFLSHDKVPYVTIPLNGIIRDVEINSKYYEQYLLLQYYQQQGLIATDVKDAVKLSKAIAIINQKIIPVYTRFNFDGKKLLLDLCDNSNRLIYASKNGWKFVNRTEYKFIQPDYLKPLPVPDENGDILDLLEFLDFDNHMDKVMVIIWVVAALFSEIDRPILMISGRQGSGKTTVADIIRSTIDPTDFTGLGLPSKDRDFAVTLHRQQIPSFDNLTFIKGDLQDLMCRVVTGGSIERCMLYTDNESFNVKSLLSG